MLRSQSELAEQLVREALDICNRYTSGTVFEAGPAIRRNDGWYVPVMGSVGGRRLSTQMRVDQKMLAPALRVQPAQIDLWGEVEPAEVGMDERGQKEWDESRVALARDLYRAYRSFMTREGMKP